MKQNANSTLRLPALEIRQGPRRTLYTFAVDGKELANFATISRIGRTEEHTIKGYQRPEVLSHIADIQQYLESSNPMIPNAIVVAFNRSVKFEPSPKNGNSVSYSRPGELVIPFRPDEPDEKRPAWIVNGQQRMAAICSAKIKSFPICVVGFIAGDDGEQREQFILVNSTKPLPKGLIYELLPATQAKLPAVLQRRRFPAHLLDRLNHDEDSPLRKMVRTPTSGEGVIKDNSLLKMLENSMSDGVLYRFRDAEGEHGDVEEMLKVLKSFWDAVRQVFESAWGLPSRKSRLMHGAGVVSLGFVMDAIADRHRRVERLTVKQFREDLEPMKEICRWTDGYWDFGPGAQLKWNEVQNTPRHVQMLANYLLVQYKVRVWNRVDRKGKA